GDVAEEDDVAVGPPLVGLGHLAGDGHRLPAAAAVVADGDERHPVVGGGPGPGPEDDVGGLPGDEVLAGEQRQHVATEADAGRHGPGGSQGRPQELSPVHATRATWGAGALPAPLTTLRDLPGRDEGRCGGRSLGTARGALTAPGHTCGVPLGGREVPRWHGPRWRRRPPSPSCWAWRAAGTTATRPARRRPRRSAAAGSPRARWRRTTASPRPPWSTSRHWPPAPSRASAGWPSWRPRARPPSSTPGTTSPPRATGVAARRRPPRCGTTRSRCATTTSPPASRPARSSGPSRSMPTGCSSPSAPTGARSTTGCGPATPPASERRASASWSSPRT